MKGYVYIINQLKTDFYKIGITKNADRRIKQLQTGNPIQLEYKKVFKYSGREKIYRVEKKIHNWLKPYKHQSEWFRLKNYNYFEGKINKFINELNKGKNIDNSYESLTAKESRCNII